MVCNQCVIMEAAEKLATTFIAYDKAIKECANDPERMASFCTTTGDDLDVLYDKLLCGCQDVLLLLQIFSS